ncbi:MAG: hypothetical protein GEU26_07585 [Nitrososphaeraceae archaeon]|nr:hypothetical protein [Nitrososphaeraceae archaeon]
MPSLYREASIFFLVLLSGFFLIVFGGPDHIYVLGSVDCDRQTFPLVDCPPLSPSEEETNNDDDDVGGNIEEQIPSGESETNNDIDDGNIMAQIPSVIPFP